MLANVKIEQDNEYFFGHRVYVNGNQIEKITGIKFDFPSFEIPTVELEILSGIDFEGKAEVNFVNAPFTIQNACKILLEELMKHGDLYDGLVASIESSLKEQKVTGLPFQPESDIAKNILKRIIGEE